ncbi:MAG: PilX N-terminal domain-containing pilus assembly protein, partial [Gammaproteobacteria bacterium]|nr:PilX N-terminal domain-containing pilus assembly protein [Gammaproteobacteria bacterium]
MKPNLNLRPPASQRGVATLMIALVLLLAATFITVYSARVGLNEQRMAANDSRAKESFQNAEGGLEYAKSWLLANRDSFSGWSWTDCADGDTDLPCGYAGVNQYTSVWSYVSMPSSLITELNWTVSSGPYVYTQSPGAEWQPLVMAARGNSLDTTGEAVVKQGMSKFTIVNQGPVPPVMAPIVDIDGAMTILANPNPTNCGVPNPLSIWTAKDFASLITTNAFATCAQGDFRGNNNIQCIGPGILDELNVTAWDPPCSCVDDYSSKDASTFFKDSDVVDNDPDFPYDPILGIGTPEDLFAYVFSRGSVELK